jgi:AraC family transcriptional regulator
MSMIEEIGELHLAQEDGRLPTPIGAGRAPGESGVSVLAARFENGAHFSGTLRQNLVLFPMSQIRFDCRLADRRRTHAPPKGTLAICPAGIDCGADGNGSIDIVLIAIDQSQLALAAAEESGGYGRLMERFVDRDKALVGLARKLWQETAAGFPNGPLLWSQLAIGFVEGLVDRHTCELESRLPGMLDRAALRRIREYVVAHLGEPLELATLARIAGRSPFHFSRMFAQSVGMTPHRYVVQLRLQHAMELLREGRLRLADVAASTGFADQSHLSRWVRRVYGVSPSRLTD